MFSTKRISRSTPSHHPAPAGAPPTAQVQHVPVTDDSASGDPDNEECCPICHDQSSLHPVAVTGCKHTFHRACLEKWCKACDRQRRTFICPVCRARLLPESFEINDGPQTEQHANNAGFADEDFGDDFDARWNSSDFVVMDTYMPGRTPGMYSGAGMPDHRSSRPVAEIDSADYMRRRHAGQLRYTAFGFGPMTLDGGYQSEQRLFSPRVHRRV